MFEHKHPLNLIDMWSKHPEDEEEYDEKEEEMDDSVSKHDIRYLCNLCSKEITWYHRYDKHPMNLSYFPIENHKSEYFCEVCEVEFDPVYSFYHCRVCAESMHPACAPLKAPEDKASDHGNAIYRYVNMKSGDL
nr:zinc finger, PHD-type [Tanacetum cinerariifolium]